MCVGNGINPRYALHWTQRLPVPTLVAPILSENLMIIPSVTENIRGGERSSDIYSRLLRDRIVFLGTAIDANVANAIIAQPIGPIPVHVAIFVISFSSILIAN